MRFEYVNCYQVLHNVTYVATYLSLMNLYRIQIVPTAVETIYGSALFLLAFENILNVLI